MGYQDEWLLLEAEDDVDEIEHRQPTEEFLFYQEVSNEYKGSSGKLPAGTFFGQRGGWNLITECGDKSEISFCDNNGDDY